jgi:hypothetical protein
LNVKPYNPASPNAEEARSLIATGLLDPASVRVVGRDTPFPVCETSAWYAPRAFEGQELSYWLCKWCGYRWTTAEGQEAATLALPVYHNCTGQSRLLTWHQFEGEPYREKLWTCKCGARLLVIETLRPFPRFSRDPGLMEKPGD